MGGGSLNLYAVISVCLFAVGFLMLLLERNLLKKILGMDIMDASMFLLLCSFGYVEGRVAPIVQAGTTADASYYTNPIPSGLILTGIVVSVSISAVLLALVVRIYRRYHSLDLDKIYLYAQEEDD